jgi:hypothetical protein
VARLLAVNVGLPQNVQWRGETVYTGIWKRPVPGLHCPAAEPCRGGQGDLGGHGGERRAVMIYQIDSYQYWEQALGRSDFTFGQFGENFTVDGLPDDEVCIGDRYRIGSAVFEVTQPRVTCYRVGIRARLRPSSHPLRGAVLRSSCKKNRRPQEGHAQQVHRRGLSRGRAGFRSACYSGLMPVSQPHSDASHA